MFAILLTLLSVLAAFDSNRPQGESRLREPRGPGRYAAARGPARPAGPLYERGRTYYRAGFYKKALKCWIKAMEREPGFVLPYLAAGQAMNVLADDMERRGSKKQLGTALAEVREQAVAAFGKAVELAPEEAMAYALRGGSRLRLGCYEEALADLDGALRLEPSDEAARWDRLLALANLGRWEAVALDFDRLVEAHPEKVEYRRSRAGVNERLGRLDLAVADHRVNCGRSAPAEADIAEEACEALIRIQRGREGMAAVARELFQIALNRPEFAVRTFKRMHLQQAAEDLEGEKEEARVLESGLVTSILDALSRAEPAVAQWTPLEAEAEREQDERSPRLRVFAAMEAYRAMADAAGADYAAAPQQYLAMREERARRNPGHAALLAYLDLRARSTPMSARFQEQLVRSGASAIAEAASTDGSETASARVQRETAMFSYAGEAAAAAQDWDNARYHFSRAVGGYGPTRRMGYYGLARLAYSKGRYKKALREMDRAVRLAPGNSFFLAFRALIHERLGQAEESLADRRALGGEDAGLAWVFLREGRRNTEVQTDAFRRIPLEICAFLAPKTVAGSAAVALLGGAPSWVSGSPRWHDSPGPEEAVAGMPDAPVSHR